MFKTTFISSTLAYTLVSLLCVGVGITPGPTSSDPAFVIGYTIGLVLACAFIGAFAGGIAVLMFRPSAIRA